MIPNLYFQSQYHNVHELARHQLSVLACSRQILDTCGSIAGAESPLREHAKIWSAGKSREHGAHSQCVANAIPVGVCPNGAFVSQPITLDPESQPTI